jgi:anti-sigma B factor antagonist
MMALKSPGSGPQVEERGGVTVVRLGAREVANLQVLGATLSGLAETTRGHEFLVDFGAIEFFNAAALTVLLRLQKQLAASGRRLGLFNLRPAVAEVFEVTRLDRLFDIRPAEVCPAHGPSSLTQPRK